MFRPGTDDRNQERCRLQVEFVLRESDVDSPDRKRVVRYFRDLVNRGRAEWHVLDDGSVHLRLESGGIYLLGRKTITRIV